ncbi:MAG: TM2 domain-containing protein [Corynebacterium sp.]|uniref:TM2 domain-containing protein n=1 Tax=Corynebacterium sp. TaxID=1720 RepID=UPI0026DAFA26|nr:TM2 domain-containing protein [Corynebacterium sp.]MDO4761277.1 TM2 domain-containing protein [Corynebacterium sp.]
MSQPYNFGDQGNEWNSSNSQPASNPFNSASYPPAHGTSGVSGADVPYATPEIAPQYQSPSGAYPSNSAFADMQSTPSSFMHQQPFHSAMVPMQPGYAVPVVQKSWVVTLVLAFFLGGWGAHNFYLGNNGRAFAQLALTVLGILTSILLVGIFLLMIVGVWVFVEIIMTLTGAGGYDTDARGVPLLR